MINPEDEETTTETVTEESVVEKTTTEETTKVPVEPDTDEENEEGE